MLTSTPRRALGESNVYVAVDDHSPAAGFKEKHELRVSTSPIAKEKAAGTGPASKRARTPADFPQLFTPGGCPQDSEAVYEDFGTVYMEEKSGTSVPKVKQIRHRSSASEPAPPVSGGQATPLVKRDRRMAAPSEGKLAVLQEEEDPFACLNPTAQCTVS